MSGQEVSLCIHTLLYTVPPVLLRILPYKNKLRMRFGLIMLLLALILGAQLAFTLYYLRRAQPDLQSLQTMRFLVGLTTMPLPYLVVREDFFKNTFVWLIAIAYSAILTRLATFIEIRLFSGMTIELFFIENSIILLCMLVFTWPPVYIFVRRAIVPALGSAASSVARFIWVVPGFFLLNYFVYITDLRVEQITNAHYMLLIIPLVGGIAISSYTLLRLLQQAAEKARLNAQVATMRRQMDMQKEQYLQMAVNEENINRARHDLRHQLAAIKSMISNGETAQALAYCDRLAGNSITVERFVYCQNTVVNAVVAHYLALAKNSEIAIEAHVDVPQDTGRVLASDVCLIIGNLLENAVDACLRIPQEKRFLKLSSRLRYGKLFITLDNSFGGDFVKKEGVYLSSKREGAGIGLSSIEAVCGEYGGYAKFEGDGEVFRSSVVLLLEA